MRCSDSGSSDINIRSILVPHMLQLFTAKRVRLIVQVINAWTGFEITQKQAQRDRKQRSAAFPGGQDRPTTPERPPSILRIPTAAWPVGGEMHPDREWSGRSAYVRARMIMLRRSPALHVRTFQSILPPMHSRSKWPRKRSPMASTRVRRTTTRPSIHKVRDTPLQPPPTTCS